MSLAAPSQDGGSNARMLTVNKEHDGLLNSEEYPIPLQINWDGPEGFDGREIASELAWMLERGKGMEIVTVEENVSVLSEVSLWVLSQMQAVSHFLGLSFEGVEKQAIELFTALEREISLSSSGIENRRLHREV